ncbi:MAG: putative RNA methyltransferase, partial [Ktedonobacterales bacterium]
MLICPICGEPLTRETPPAASACYRCPNRHSFDVARQGYVNLLARPTRLLADTLAMLRARRAFLARGHYAPLAAAVNDLVWAGVSSASQTDPAVPPAVLDVGCGEGYYIGRLADALAHSGDWRCFGLDLARDAARLAATASPQVTLF